MKTTKGRTFIAISIKDSLLHQKKKICWPPGGNNFFCSSKIEIIYFESESVVNTTS